MTSVHELTEPRWRELARQASAEKDHEKMLDLLQQVIEKYDEERQQMRRIANAEKGARAVLENLDY
jgi:gamma-glutamyl:cysteine ligase YbdK (ATP-grasp superfamily)